MSLSLVLGAAIGGDTTINGKKKPRGDIGVVVLPTMLTMGTPGNVVRQTVEIASIADGLKVILPAEMNECVAQLVLPNNSAQVQFIVTDGVLFIEGSLLIEYRGSSIDSFVINLASTTRYQLKLEFVFGRSGGGKLLIY